MNDETSVVRTIGRYHVLDELGRGGMGVVYRGFDPVIGRTIALKTIGFGSDDDEARKLRERLYREASAAGTLTHQNIVTIYDVLEDGGTTAVAMEFIEGQTLAALVSQQGPLPLDRAIDVFEQICSALDYAGSKGIVHRDIKPTNIVMSPDGRPKVMDFGIARMSLSGLTQTGTILGSPSYMSPEQVRGLTLDARSDLFSAAVVFYEMITGERPFGGDDVATTMYRIVNEPPRAVEQLNPTINPAVAGVLQRALAKSPSERYQTGAELVAELKRTLGMGASGSFAVIGPGAAPVEVTVPKARSPILVYGGIGLGALVIVIIGLFVFGSPPQGDAGGGAPQLQGTAIEADPSAAAVPPAAMPEKPPPAVAATPPAAARSYSGPMSTVPPPNVSATQGRAGGALPARPGPPPGGISPVNDRSPAGRSGIEAPASVTPTPAAPVEARAPALQRAAPPETVVERDSPAPPKTGPPPGAAPVPAPSAPAVPASGEAVLRVEFDGQPYAFTLFSGDSRLGRVEGAGGTVNVEAGALRLRAVNEAIFLNADLGSVTVRPGERRTISLPASSSAVFSVKGEDYAGVRILIDGRQISGPYPAQIARIAAGPHRVVYRWTSGSAAGREIADTVTLSAGGHFIIRAVQDNDQLVVQQLR